ncbi:MAG: hypothetical protein ACRYGF_14820 [Janthinobacterium lividum]
MNILEVLVNLDNYAVRVELFEATPEKLLQVDDILSTLNFGSYATKKDSDSNWFFCLPSGLYFGQSDVSAAVLCQRVSTSLKDHQLECRVFVSKVVDWAGTEVSESAL